MPIKQITKFGKWIGNQADGFVGGLMRTAQTKPSYWLPAGVWNTILWLVASLKWAFGSSTPTRQITASVALGIFALLTSWVTLGATIVLVFVYGFTFSVGILRLIPVVDQYFVSIREMLVP